MNVYYKLKYGENYIIKIVVLVLVSVLAEYVIWWAMIREESVDWIAGHINHRPWPYAVTELENGKTIIGNVILGFEITLLSGWKVQEDKHPSFYLNKEEDASAICEITSKITKREEEIQVNNLLGKNKGYNLTYFKNFSAITKEITSEEGNYIYDIKIIINNNILEYTLFANANNKNKCRREFEKIRRSWFYYPDA